MSSPKATARMFEAARRESQRVAKLRQRDLERQAKEMEKLSALQQARLEVETYENGLDILLSVHKEQADALDWLSIVSSLPPVPPRGQSHNELKARQRQAVTPYLLESGNAIERAKEQDERDFQEAMQTHAADVAEWENMTSLARRILGSDTDAYIKAIEELSPFTELSTIGSSFHFKVHSRHLIEVNLTTNGRQAIPAEVKTLTSTGKVSVKAMPKPRFLEIYQDYVCGCVLRVARELFALLPIDALLITASAEALDTSTGHTLERPFLSVFIPRATLAALNFDTLDPSDSIMAMTHRGDLKASRKTGEFEFIAPLTVSDLTPSEAPGGKTISDLLGHAKRLRTAMVTQCERLAPQQIETSLLNGETA